MPKNNKTPATVAAVGRETEQAKQQKPNSIYNCITDTDKKQEDFFIAGMLPRGSENAVTTAELLRRTGYACKRQLTKAIQAERKAGALIASRTDGQGGYFQPSSRAELEDYVRSMDHRARSIMFTIKTARKALREMDKPPEA